MRITITLKTIILLTLLAWTSSAAAEVYRWVDENGKVHFSDRKPVEDNAETVDIKAPPVLPPDEGELRRRELLRRAEEDFAYKRRRAAEDQAAEDARVEEFSNTHAARQSKCDDARIRLGVLTKNMPIYWTTSGELRPAWSNDMYRGTRRYIEDHERPALRAEAERDIQAHCRDPDNTDAQYYTYRQWEHQQWCQALRAELDFARQARQRKPREEVEALDARYTRDCS